MFEGQGYSVCADGELEEGYEKIALYSVGGAPKHAARQLGSGIWTSKLGEFIDITHASPSSVEDSEYGKVVLFMKRPREQPENER
jgi:hypothetical protein